MVRQAAEVALADGKVSTVTTLPRAGPRSSTWPRRSAPCALRWPKWPAYRGPLDLEALRRALATVPIDPDTLHWLGSDELARACRSAPAMPLGP
jgi:hypothetical protein